MLMPTWQRPFQADPAPPSADGWVTRTGKIFEVGAYPDKDFALTEAEADAALAGFTGADLELEHFASEGRPSILDGALGQVASVVRQGADLIGTVRVPAWLDSLWARYGRKISAVWQDRDPATGAAVPKRLIRAGLVLDPRIPDATLFAAAFAGARDSRTTRGHMQQVHDLAVQHGATCAATFAGARDSRETRGHMQQVHDLAVTHGARCAAPAMYSQEAPGMPNFFEELAALFSRHNVTPAAEAGAGPQPSPDPAPAPSPAPTPSPAPAPTPPSTLTSVFSLAAPLATDPQIAQMQAEIATLRATQAQQVADARRAQAAAQVETLITGHYLLPAARTFSTDLLTQALADDARAPHTFAGPQDTQLTRAGMLLAGWRAMGPHALTGEAVALFGAPEGPPDEQQADLDAADAAIVAHLAKRAVGQKEAT